MLAAASLDRLARRVRVAQQVHIGLGGLLDGRGPAYGEARCHRSQAGLALRDARKPGVPELGVHGAWFDRVYADRGEVEG